MLLINDQFLKYDDAKCICSQLGSQLVEFDNEYEYNEVLVNLRNKNFVI